MYTLMPPIEFYILYSVATPGYLELLPLENYNGIVAFTSDLQRVSFYSITDDLLY
jgi:hypothetical protein